MCRLFETVCICDGRPQHLAWHEKRMERSRKSLWGLEEKISLEELIRVPEGMSAGILRCNVHYATEVLDITYKPWTGRVIRSLKLVYDDEVEYSLKYHDRVRLEELLAQKGECDEILIVKNGFITDTSISNVIFHDGKQWFTSDTPLLAGTTRERLLSEKKIFLKTIKPQNLKDYSGLKLINAMRLPEEEAVIPVASIR